MSVSVSEINSKKELALFAQFPFDLYKHTRYWVPPVRKDELQALLPESNPAFRFCECKWWLAKKHGRIVGRIGAIINHRYNEKTGEKMARFTRLEFIDDEEVSGKLLDAAEKWARQRGMNGIHGPLGFSNLDHQGLLIEGFDQLPSIASEYHMPYYRNHIEKKNYCKEIDWLEFRLTIENIPEKAKRLAEAIKSRYGLHIIRFSKREAIRPYADKIFKLLNEAFSDLFSVASLDSAMRKYYVERYLNFLNPRFVILVADKQNELAGFIIGMPSLSEAMQKAKGRIFPFGWIHLRKALNTPSVVDLMLTAVRPDLQAQGIPAILITELQQTMIDYGVQYAETTGILETNEKAIQVWKNYKHIQHKRKRCYKKIFSQSDKTW